MTDPTFKTWEALEAWVKTEARIAEDDAVMAMVSKSGFTAAQIKLQSLEYIRRIVAAHAHLMPKGQDDAK